MKSNEYQANMFFPRDVYLVTAADDDGIDKWIYIERANALSKAKCIFEGLLDELKTEGVIDPGLSSESDEYTEIVHESNQWRVDMGTRGPGPTYSNGRCSVFIDLEPYTTINVSRCTIADI